jgi:hypothetical protein
MIWDCLLLAREAGTDTRRNLAGSNAEIECDGDAQSVATVGPDLMKEPRGKQEQEARPRPDGFRSADRLAVFSHEFQTRRVHSRSRTARIKHFELAAQDQDPWRSRRQRRNRSRTRKRRDDSGKYSRRPAR